MIKAAKNLEERERALRPEIAARQDWTEVGEGEHIVQFYEGDPFLVKCVAEYVLAGLKAGEAAVVIASREHLQGIETLLGTTEWAVLREAQAEGRYFGADAAKTLGEIRQNGGVDESRVRAGAAELIELAGADGRPVRVFGEMVALLWAEGDTEGALRLEHVWDELARSHPFTLLCAYPMKGFEGAEHSQAFKDICTAHSRVIPTERFPGEASREAQLRQVGLLQQKATSLQAERIQRCDAESAFRAERTKLDIAVAIARLGIWELDMVTNRLSGTQECKFTLGLAANEELTYERFWSRVHPADRSAAESALRTAVNLKRDYQAEFRILDDAGQVRWVACLGRCFKHGKHRLLGVVQDVTERKHDLGVLEQKVGERTAQLEEAMGELEAFSYSISHDLRAPLRAVQGFAKAVLEDHSPQLDAEGIAQLQLIQRAAQRMDMLIRDVLCYSQLAKTQIELKPVALGPFIDDLLKQWPEFVRAGNCIAVEPPLHAVVAHEACLTQCLRNLLANALKFVAPGKLPQVRIRTEAVGDKVKVSVIDNGIGINPKHRSKIFKIFSRLHSEGAYEGTGIGLAIVKKAVARMGGEAGFESAPGVGSTFWFTLRGVIS